MKKLSSFFSASLMLLASSMLFQGCFKDTVSHTYSLFQPVYKTVAEVRAGIKSDAAMPVVNPGKIFLYGNYIFLNEINKGVHIIDNTNPSAPVNKYFVSIPGNLDLAVKGNTLYADLYRDLVTIDISNPASIVVKKITEKVFPARTYSNWFIGDSTRVIVDWIKKDTTVSVGDENFFQGREDVVILNFSSNVAASPAAADTKNGISGSTARFTLLNNYLYTVTNSSINVFDVSQPQDPEYTNSIEAGWLIETIYPFKNKLFIGSRAGMYIFDISNPALPEYQSQVSHITACDPVVADDDNAFVTLSAGSTCHGDINELDVLDVQDPSQPELIKVYPLTNPHGLSKIGNTLFVCDGTAGVKVYDASNVLNLQLLQNVTGIEAYDIIAVNNNAIVVGKDGLYQYDFSDLSHLKLRSKLTVNRFK